jgi:hypothetical protein
MFTTDSHCPRPGTGIRGTALAASGTQDSGRHNQRASHYSPALTKERAGRPTQQDLRSASVKESAWRMLQFTLMSTWNGVAYAAVHLAGAAAPGQR